MLLCIRLPTISQTSPLLDYFLLLLVFFSSVPLIKFQLEPVFSWASCKLFFYSEESILCLFLLLSLLISVNSPCISSFFVLCQLLLLILVFPTLSVFNSPGACVRLFNSVWNVVLWFSSVSWILVGRIFSSCLILCWYFSIPGHFMSVSWFRGSRFCQRCSFSKGWWWCWWVETIWGVCYPQFLLLSSFTILAPLLSFLLSLPEALISWVLGLSHL